MSSKRTSPTPVETTGDAPEVYKPGALEVVFPMAFTACFAWVVWNMPAFLMVFREAGPAVDALARRYGEIMVLDWVAVAGSILFLVLGVKTVRRAPSEWEDWGLFDRVSVFVGRVTMLLIVVLVTVMVYEVVLRYVFERPTLWANEMSLWLAGFIFMLAGLYSMQQRSHIRIFLLYDVMPRWLQRCCDTFSTLLIVVFAFALFYGGWGEARDKFLRWETFGTAFDPPIPATLKPMLLFIVILVAIQAVANLIRDWNAEPVIHTAADDIDQDELERLRRQVGEN
ncbi:TRAP transporter small permease subunit [Jannaschia seohaensis]|uniref:TRAP transporter small permease protein n=1 Tax=Jannaschia seohaensis TaxID=475081 RepID=A0A2Y9ANE7_9RHOB|nr:TRAP transporter small permease subunit [Jannaschia seohaensis]PWJ19228.1 TRAP-type mannitol/chloroaromatic compound transport system permease small subunit [Jannaschia seohaensis]SSA45890.1 TRAP-type mannitol/chloroaromatic compound transport system, small permease component [Jannaschia seohaensis]